LNYIACFNKLTNNVRLTVSLHYCHIKPLASVAIWRVGKSLYNILRFRIGTTWETAAE